jgi:hypothetical protein
MSDIATILRTRTPDEVQQFAIWLAVHRPAQVREAWRAWEHSHGHPGHDGDPGTCPECHAEEFGEPYITELFAEAARDFEDQERDE